ncbi:hypothetical protein [Pyxidicoccus xibeiensis]|uniref:hypothetical protein n=1 Tax=Pyxidicoccus xibeiensis TaxID=2906759 RepID=UPI0020A7DB84|nr:hypothetical protein [Pyxidicoccus xibeiensis]MCP3142274.1 hypothetical protein [Pyxidicoccus xibeiensis]
MSLVGFSFASELRGPSDGLRPAPAALLARLRPHHDIDLTAGEIRSDVARTRALREPAYEVTGLCRLATTDELAAAFPGAAFLDPLPPCPFRGEHLGWLLWVVPDIPDESSLLGMRLAELSLGRSVDLRNGRFFDAMVESELPLADVVNKWGFGDGDLLLGDRDHEAYVSRRLEEALRHAGVHARVTSPSTFMTGHNAFRIPDADEQTIRRLQGRTVELWARHPLLIRPGPFFET